MKLVSHGIQGMGVVGICIHGLKDFFGNESYDRAQPIEVTFI